MPNQSFSRRTILRKILPGIAAGIAGCQELSRDGQPVIDRKPEPNQTDKKAPHRPATSQTVVGQVLSLEDQPVRNASVKTMVENGRTVATTTTTANGSFEIDTEGRPVWLMVTHQDYLSRVRAVAPTDQSYKIRLTSDQDTIAVNFGGDVMFGRRFYDRETDPFDRHFWIDPNTLLSDHQKILSFLKPILSHGDLTSVNLETPLTTAKWRHPTKTYTFVSHPVAAKALAASGVDYVSLANTHTFDALTPGLDETITSLNEAGIAHSGAGSTSTVAWEPKYLTRNGIEIAFVSCTTTAGEQYELDWSADRNQSQTHTIQHPDQSGKSLSIPGTVGVAEATSERITTVVQQAQEKADIVVVQIHGGDEGVRTPTTQIKELSAAASQVGADLVINHHPHVTGGLEYQSGTLVAWTLGNLVFDQHLWETFPSYVLTVHIHRNGTIRRAFIEPILIDGYVPKGVVGDLRRKLVWQIAGLSSDDLTVSESDLELIPSVQSGVAHTEAAIEGRDRIYTRHQGWIDSIENIQGTVRLGRDRLLTGSFSHADVDKDVFEAPLWRFGRDQSSIGGELGYETPGGIRLTRSSGNSQRSLLRPVRRIPIQGNDLTLTGWYRFDGHAMADIDVSWYDDSSGGSFENLSFQLSRTNHDWERFRFQLTPPEEASYVQLFCWLAPPSSNSVSRITFDDIRLIEWDHEATGGREFDHLYMNGSARVSVAASQSPRTIRNHWRVLNK